MLNIFTRNGKEYLKIGKNVWKNYLNEVAPFRKYDINIINCSLRNKNVFWCNTCNTGIGAWSDSCVHIITSLNLQKHEDILKDDKKDIEFYEIEIDRNNDRSTI